MNEYSFEFTMDSQGYYLGLLVLCNKGHQWVMNTTNSHSMVLASYSSCAFKEVGRHVVKVCNTSAAGTALTHFAVDSLFIFVAL